MRVARRRRDAGLSDAAIAVLAQATTLEFPLLPSDRTFGFEAVSVGVEMRKPRAASGQADAPLTEEQLRRLRESMPDLITQIFPISATFIR